MVRGNLEVNLEVNMEGDSKRDLRMDLLSRSGPGQVQVR